MIIVNPIVRRAHVNDCLQVYSLIDIFFKESAGQVGFTWNEKDAKSLMFEVAKYHVAFVAEVGKEIVGVISGSITESPFNSEQKIFKELFWYVIPEWRGDIGKDLFKKCMEFLKYRDIELAIFASHKGNNDSGLDNFYFFQDFTPMETLWIKKI